MLGKKVGLVLSKRSSRASSGLTLLENLVVVVIIGLLAAIASPICLYLILSLKLNIAQDEVSQAIRKAQQNSRLNRIIWDFNIRQTSDGQVQWAIHPNGTPTAKVLWKNLDPQIQLDKETTLVKVQGIHRVQFNHLGAVNGQLGRVTLSSKNLGKTKRCVIVSTLLGAVRLGSDKAKAVDGKYCR